LVYVTLLAGAACGTSASQSTPVDASVDAAPRDASTSSGDGSATPSDASAGGDAADASPSTSDAGLDATTTFDPTVGLTRICDIKNPLASPDAGSDPGNGFLTADNYVTVLDAMKASLGCTAIRVFIDVTNGTPPAQYSDLYKDVLQHARVDLGLRIFANPLGFGAFAAGYGTATSEAAYDVTYANVIIAYANYFQPDFLGPFNESGFDASDIGTILGSVRAGLTYRPLLVGPDMQMVAASLKLATTDPTLAASFDIFGSHNANDDDAATASAWNALVTAVPRPVWSDENPRPLDDETADGVDIGVSAAVDGGVHGVVLYEAYSRDVRADGSLTSRGSQFANGLPPVP
jgi:hypothetical protein